MHQRDVTRVLINNAVDSPRGFEWLQQMRFYFDPRKSDVLEQLSIHMANAKFNYGFEYLGVTDKLVQTPLTDRCYLTMTQALEERLGGSPFGPAGTGKTESVKALGNQLGRFVLVFNCDETFDFQVWVVSSCGREILFAWWKTGFYMAAFHFGIRPSCTKYCFLDAVYPSSAICSSLSHSRLCTSARSGVVYL